MPRPALQLAQAEQYVLREVFNHQQISGHPGVVQFKKVGWWWGWCWWWSVGAHVRLCMCVHVRGGVVRGGERGPLK